MVTLATPEDDEARWVGHRPKAPGGEFVREIAITPANVNDGRMRAAVLPESPGEVYADLAYARAANEAQIRVAGGRS